MSELSSKFTRDDVETLLEAMNDWETLGNQEFYILQQVKNAPMPPEDHETHEFLSHIKQHFKQREKDIMMSRDTRQEKSVFLKAKLMIVRRELGVSQLFDMASNVDASVPLTKKKVEPVTSWNDKPSVKKDESKQLEWAEFFIKDLGVWDHYQKFLSEKKAESDSSEKAPD